MNPATPNPAPQISLKAAQKKYPHLVVPSPCIGLCKMNDTTGWCAGCFRSLDEIASWSRLADDQKRGLWAVVESRQATCLVVGSGVSEGGS